MYILKEVAFDKIKTEHLPIIEDVKKSLLNYEDKIYSIYIYGSVATGKSKSPTSDVDFLIVLKRKPSKELEYQLKKVEENLTIKYKKLFREIGFAITNKNEVLRGKEIYAWKFFISTICLLIYGKNIILDNLQFTPTKKLAKSLYNDLDKDIKTSKEKILNPETKEVEIPIKHIMKVILRVSFCIIMEEANAWTTDLKEMADIFLRYYPDKSFEITNILKLIENPTDKDKAIQILNTYGKWVSDKFYAL